MDYERGGLGGGVGLRASLAVVLSVGVGGIQSAALGDDPLLPFTEEAVARGIDAMMAPFPAGFGFFGFGCGFADLDGDGWTDAFAYGRSDKRLALWRNRGADGFPGHFQDRTFTSGIAPIVQPSGAYPIDFDGDGLVDLFLVNTGFQQSQLHRNVGNFEFVNATASSGIVTAGHLTKGCAIADFDGDGWPDIYMGNYVTPLGNDANMLWRNLGDGTFENVATAAGVASIGATLEAVWVDYDRDGLLDLYLSNDRGTTVEIPGNQLYRNNGDGTFTEVTATSGAAALAFCSMGVAVGDLTRNGYPDFYCTNSTSPTGETQGEFPLMLNLGNGSYLEGQTIYGVDAPSNGGSWGWGTMMLDVDNDGWLDVHVTLSLDPNRLYRGGPKPPMIDSAAALAIAGQTETFNYSSAFADVDGDGAIDLLFNDMGQPVRLHMNHEGALRTAVRFRVVGVGTDTQAIGASATLTLGRGKSAQSLWTQTHVGGNSYLGVNEQVLHFGIGSATHADAVDLRWPSGTAMRPYTSVPAGTWTAWPPERLGDLDGDGVVGPADRLAFCAAQGPVIPGTEIFDFDGDFVIDLADRAELIGRFTGTIADLDGNGVVDGADLGMLLTAWGTSSCVHDLNGDGTVNAVDLGVMLLAWTR